jgi:hypothetical protein
MTIFSAEPMTGDPTIDQTGGEAEAQDVEVIARAKVMKNATKE